jgi:hypothetical protein
MTCHVLGPVEILLFSASCIGISLTSGKRRLNFASFTTKECLNFPVATHYHVDIITHAIFLTGKFNAN